MKTTPTMLRMRGSHSWLVQTTDGFPLAPPFLIHELYFSRAARTAVCHTRHRQPFVRCRKTVHRTVGSFMN